MREAMLALDEIDARTARELALTLGGFRSSPGIGFTGLQRGIVMVIGCPGWRLARRWCR